MTYFSKILELLIAQGEFKRTLDLFNEVVDSGIRVDKFSYGKAGQAAVKLGDLRRGVELKDSMIRRRVGASDFVYNVLIGGFCKEGRIGMHIKC